MPATRPSGSCRVVNVAESSIARESDLALPSFAGVEGGRGLTKAFNELTPSGAISPSWPPPARRINAPREASACCRGPAPRFPASSTRRLRWSRRSRKRTPPPWPRRAPVLTSVGPRRRCSPHGRFRGRGETQGNQLHPCRRLCLGRSETRPHSRWWTRPFRSFVLAPLWTALFDKTRGSNDLSGAVMSRRRLRAAMLAGDAIHAEGAAGGRGDGVWQTLVYAHKGVPIRCWPRYSLRGVSFMRQLIRLPHGRPAQGHGCGPAPQPCPNRVTVE